jgi:hypothetical protein
VQFPYPDTGDSRTAAALKARWRRAALLALTEPNSVVLKLRPYFKSRLRVRGSCV